MEDRRRCPACDDLICASPLDCAWSLFQKIKDLERQVGALKGVLQGIGDVARAVAPVGESDEVSVLRE